MDIGEIRHSESGSNNHLKKMERKNHFFEFCQLFPHKFHFVKNHKEPKHFVYKNFQLPDN